MSNKAIKDINKTLYFIKKNSNELRRNTQPLFNYCITLDSPQVGAATHGAHEEASFAFHHLL